MRLEFNAATRREFSGKRFDGSMSSLGYRSVNVGNKKCYVGLRRLVMGLDEDAVDAV